MKHNNHQISDVTVVKFLRFRKILWDSETTYVYPNEGERQIVERGKKRKKNARGVALLVVGGIAARALWSYMVKRSDAGDRKMEDGEKNIASEVAAERKAASSAKLTSPDNFGRPVLGCIDAG